MQYHLSIYEIVRGLGLGRGLTGYLTSFDNLQHDFLPFFRSSGDGIHIQE